MTLSDSFLPIAALLFLLPLNPTLSTLPVLAWVLLQLIFAPANTRLFAWAFVFVLLLFGRSWLLNEMYHPISSEDGLIFVGALFAAACVPPNRWPNLLRFLLLVLPMLLFQVGSKPWTPNPMVGANQGAYLIGLILLVSYACFLQNKQSFPQRLLAAIATLLAALLVWQTGSRAALVAALISAASLWIYQGCFLRVRLKRCLMFFVVGAFALAAKQFLRPSMTGIPGIDISSDTGRLAIAQCYAAIPFSGSNRFLYGVGFDRAAEFCSDPVHGGVADHAHNLYLQLFASTGVFGVFGMVLLLILLLQAWRSLPVEMDPFPLVASQLAMVYTLIQGFLDLSSVHWPVTLVFTGVLLGIPLSWHITRPNASFQN